MHTKPTRTVLWFMGLSLSIVVSTMFLSAGQQPTSAKEWAGEFTVTLEGRRGPQERPLSVKEDNGKLTATLDGGRGGPLVITDVTLKGSELSLKYQLQSPQGEVPVLLTLVSQSDGTYKVTQDIAGGQFTQTGTAKRRCPPDCKK